MVAGNEPGAAWKEWKSKKIRPRWLLSHLSLTTGIGIALLSILWLSRLYSGFMEMGEAPNFLASNPHLLRAVWENGLLYTTFPTFLMALYGSMWEGIVDAVAERQPFVELWHGARSDKTVLLDYRAENKVKAVRTALRLGHHLLAVCMTMSLVLSFGVVPMTAFLFISQTPSLQYSTAVTITSELNHSLIIAKFPHGPSVRTALDWSAASVLMRAPPLPWTRGPELPMAFPRFSLPSSETAVGGTLLLNTTAYIARGSCVALEEGSDFATKLLTQPFNGLNSVAIRINGSDRGCAIDTELLFNLAVPPDGDEFKAIAATSSLRFLCFDHKDIFSTRIIFLAAKYTGDRIDNHTFSNLTAISCRPTYFLVPGTLNTTITTTTHLTPQINSFTPSWSLATQIPGGEHALFEEALLAPIYMEPGMKTRITNDFSRFVFDLAFHYHPDSPLGQPDQVASITSGMLERCYASLAATVLSQDLKTPHPTPAISITKTTRLVIVEPLAYIILLCLTLVACLTVAIMRIAAAQPSALFEEPIGVLSIAGIAQRSAHLTADITQISGERGFAGQFGERAREFPRFKDANWKYDSVERHIFDTRRAGAGLLTVTDRGSLRRYGTFV